MRNRFLIPQATESAELCRLQSLRVPDEVALIGVDNDSLVCELCSPPISSVAYAAEHAGQEAAELLHRLMSKGRVKRQKIPVRASQVVSRQSTNMIAVADAEVATALRFIRDNARRIIQQPIQRFRQFRPDVRPVRSALRP